MSRPVALVVTFLVVLALAACGSDEPETASPPATPAAPPPAPPPAAGGEEEGIRGAGGATPAGPAAAGEPVPEIVGTTLAGDPISLSDFRGEKLIVHLWSSW